MVRRKGVPIAFWLQEMNGIQRMSAGELTRRIGAEAGEKIVAETIREEMAPPSSAVSLPLADHRDLHEGPARGCGATPSVAAGQTAALPEGSAGLEILIVDNAPSDERTREVAAHGPRSGMSASLGPASTLQETARCGKRAAKSWLSG